MIKSMRESMLVVLTVLCLAGVSPAIVIHSENPLPGEVIPSVSDYQTDGADMAGMAVTAFFTASAPETAIWAVTGVLQNRSRATDCLRERSTLASSDARGTACSKGRLAPD